MTKRNSASLPLKWKLLIKKRPSLNQGIPPGKESLTWVANTVFLTAARARTDPPIAQSLTLLFHITPGWR